MDMKKPIYESPVIRRAVLLRATPAAVLAASGPLSSSAGATSGGHEVGEEKSFNTTTFNHDWN